MDCRGKHGSATMLYIGLAILVVSLAAWNNAEDSFVLDTRLGQRKFLPRYKALASIQDQPYSFSRTQLLGKQADLGSSRFSALYMQIGPPLARSVEPGVTVRGLKPRIGLSWKVAPTAPLPRAGLLQRLRL